MSGKRAVQRQRSGGWRGRSEKTGLLLEQRLRVRGPGEFRAKVVGTAGGRSNAVSWGHQRALYLYSVYSRNFMSTQNLRMRPYLKIASL